MGWHALVPARVGGKSRLTLPGDWSSACALDTIASLERCPLIDGITVLGDVQSRWSCISDGGSGLNNEISKAAIELPRPLLIILGDLPALQSNELIDLLNHAEKNEKSFVRDHAGTGTTMIMVNGDVTSYFGEGSAEQHLIHGYAELNAPESLRCDVDTLDDLRRAEQIGLGVHTTSLLK